MMFSKTTLHLTAEEPGAVDRAAMILRSSGTVAFPTETVYGLGARADRSDAVQQIFAAKGRPSTNPLIVHVSSVNNAQQLCSEWTETAALLAEQFWPGPLTLILPLRPGILAPEVTAGGVTVGIRVPSNKTTLSLLSACALPIAAPSANLSTSISSTTAEHVLRSLGGRIDCVLDAGPCAFGMESTIVDVTSFPVRLLRHGAIELERIKSCVPVIDSSFRMDPTGQRSIAPGGQVRHYAPNAKLEIVSTETIQTYLKQLSSEKRIGVIVYSPISGLPMNVLVEQLSNESKRYEAELYAALHRLDVAACDKILVEAVPKDSGWEAVCDRLTRASHPK